MKTQAFATFVLLAIATLAYPSGRGDGETGTKLSPVPPVLGITVDPPVAPPGVKRTIKVSGFSTDSCVPTEARLGRGRQTSHLSVLLTVPSSTTLCAQNFATWSFSLEYTPDMAGYQEIFVTTTEPGALGRGVLMTSYTTTVRSKHDINGAWYDPRSNGSGMMFAHRYSSTDAVFATWMIYDGAGEPRWLSLQGGRWSGDGSVLIAAMYETKSAPAVCLACATPASQVTFVGLVQITFAVVEGRLTGTFEAAIGPDLQYFATLVQLLY